MQMRIGQTVEIVYQAKSGEITQWKIEEFGISDSRIRETSLSTAAPCVFLTAKLAWQQVRKGATA